MEAGQLELVAETREKADPEFCHLAHLWGCQEPVTELDYVITYCGDVCDPEDEYPGDDLPWCTACMNTLRCPVCGAPGPAITKHTWMNR